MRERQGVSVGVTTMIAEIHGPFVKPQAITPIRSEARIAKIERAKARRKRKRSGNDEWA